MSKLRGLFLNTWKAECSIYESGKMAYNALILSDKYHLDYQEINAENRKISTNYNFFIFNYHQVTMGWLDTTCVKKIPGLKATIVLEVLPQDPFVMCPRHDFDAYIVLDPTINLPYKNVYAFPRPLEKPPALEPYIESDIPTIGSFGFPTSGKGFELVVEAVNKEFEKAIVKLNIPFGTYAHPEAQEKAKQMGQAAKAVAKPGIEVIVTHDYMEKDDLIRWCAKNTLNCFLYNRNLPGLAATTDQAIVSGRPLAVSANETFRHIHQYLTPYPFQTLRESLSDSVIATAQMMHDWSPEYFASCFNNLLQNFNSTLLKTDAVGDYIFLKILNSYYPSPFPKRALRKIRRIFSYGLNLITKKWNLNSSQSNLSQQPPVPRRPYIHHLIGSHSQYGEDLILSILFNGKNKGFYVDVGANDPHFGSNTKRFYLRGWHGINIEPDTKCFNKIRQYRESDINLNIAVGKETGQMKFYNFPDDPTISSLDLETAQRMARTLNLKFSEIVVDVLPLADVFEKYAPDKNIDFLSVDAEGYDIDVLKSNNWIKWRPSVVMVEIVLQEKKVIEYMHSIGYLHIFSNQVNSIFIDVMRETNLNHVWKKTQSNARHG